jgi:signal transduction histidine kinase
VTPEDFASLTRPFPEPHLLVSGDGCILAWNRAAARQLGLDADARGAPLARFADEAPDAIDSQVKRWARSTAFLPGALHWRNGSGSTTRLRVDGARVGPDTGAGGDDAHGSGGADEVGWARVLLRLRAQAHASRQFLELNRKIEALTREIHLRREAQETLQEQAHQLEELAAELEHTIDELGGQRAEAIEARDEAQAANRAKSDFLAMMSHELRTPLNAIIGYIDLLDAGIGGPVTDEQQSHLGRMRGSARHLLTIIEELLSFSRLDARRESVFVERVDAIALSRDVVELIEPIAAERGLAVSLHADGRAIEIETDPSKLRQILLNLLWNAVKFTDDGGISVAIAADRARLDVSVRDTGIGIARGDLERIFEPFTQVDSSRTRRAGGTGLGLAVSRELARLLGGDLTVESATGEGSTFRLRLPLSATR